MNAWILADDRVRQRGLLAEHGLSILVETDGLRLLFDTGQAAGQVPVCLANARALGLSLASLDAIVLSHGHYDHGGGLAHLPTGGRFPPVHLHPDALKQRLAGPAAGPWQDVGLPWTTIDRPDLAEALVPNSGTRALSERVRLVAGIRTTAPFEAPSAGFWIRERDDPTSASPGEDPTRAAPTPDHFHDEQVLVCDTTQGLWIFLGCSHPGVASCVDAAMAAFQGRPVHTLIAGMHLGAAPVDRVRATAQFLLDCGFRRVVPLHCTGLAATCFLLEELGDRCLPLCVGDSLEDGLPD